MPKITVIIPAYNAECYIAQCANSLFSQSLNDIEIIFIDDGSTDHTGEILDRLVSDKDNARVIHQSNQGLYKTREIGLSQASGNYIGWVDSDDFIDPLMYEKLYDVAISHNADMAYCDYDFYPEKISTKEKWFRPYSGKKDVDFVERNNQPWNKIVKRSVLEELQIGKMFTSCFDEAYIKVLINAKNPISINEKLYSYRVGNGSMSSSYKNVEHYENFISASKNLIDEIGNVDDYWKDYLNYRIIYYYLMTMLVAANAGEKNKYEELKRELLDLDDFKRNRFLDHILKKNFGRLKAFAIKNLISTNYFAASIMAKLSIGKGGR